MIADKKRIHLSIRTVAFCLFPCVFKFGTHELVCPLVWDTTASRLLPRLVPVGVPKEYERRSDVTRGTRVDTLQQNRE